MTLIVTTSLIASRYVRPIAILVTLYAGSQSEVACAQEPRLRETYHAVWAEGNGATYIRELPQDLGEAARILNASEIYSLLIAEASALCVTFYEAGLARIAGRVMVSDSLTASETRELRIPPRRIRQSMEGGQPSHPHHSPRDRQLRGAHWSVR
jgi:hypothetical protein